ncbi:hypothetical protein K450DRAFT_220035 [Umbelopsis ramanniana AG]|uniref:Association with the SNF1 complex (ASC) domain-containing protein n=1 Tax=Umbelopsis ramanniana AG TaxID=1314678 RepID=A0AAD5HGS4_UMBRA|nr:uncharacterized protein K450DRAFT_220035 [Umbelopsis ramanniana AG]KAI8583800.1 hypothetical protein K450DRAFT_220035 [Umbelopsis ramanniana AG]
MGNSTSTEHPQTSFYADNDQNASFPGVRSNPYDSPPSVNVTEPNGSTSHSRDINYSDPYLHNQARRLKQGIDSDHSSPFVGSPLSLPDEDRFRSDFNSRRNTGGPNTPTTTDKLSDRLESIDIDQKGSKSYPRPTTGDSRQPIAGSHHRSDSVKGPYYRARGHSVGREYESGADEDDSRIRRRASNLALEVSDRANTVPTIITWTQGGNNVYVTGTFNGWKQKIHLVKSSQDFSAVLELPPGTHRLKFIVDDEWKCSNDLEAATDPDGNLVNYIEVDDGLDDELDEFGERRSSLEDSSNAFPLSSSPPGTYSSEIPQYLQTIAQQSPEAASMTAQQQQLTQPPSLPPHLEKVMLNSQTISDEDNSVLPVPNHVTLNHLYACSIKDGVMALAATSRYRKKVSVHVLI